jgi:predicted DCC family thiol-disulfide oxidoreductase YuxK
VPVASSDPSPVLLFDGECGLCNRIVRLLLRTDRRARLRFAPLQGEAAQAYLRSKGLPTQDFDSLVFVPDWSEPERHAPLLRTDGALAAAAEVGGVWRLITWIRVLPAWSRDPFYKLVARTRYALFGEYRPTSLPDPAWGERFL